MARSSSGSRLGVLALLLGALLVSPLAAQDEDVPEVVRTLLEEGDRHRQAGRTDEAAARYEEARRLAPRVVATYVALGALYHGRGEWRQALEVFAAGLEQAPRRGDLLFNAAVVSLKLERAGEALAYVDRALAADGRDANLHSLKSAALRDLGRREEALEAQQTAARLAPGDAQVLYRLGNLCYELDRKDEAVDAYRRAVRKDKGYLLAYYNLGAVLFDVGRFDEALDAYQVALEPVQSAFAAGQPVDAAHARAFLNLGAIHTRKGEREAALDAYGKALRLDPTLSEALYNQGFLYFELGRLDESAHAYRRALELDASLPLAYLHLGQIAARRGRHDEAVRRLDDGLRHLTGEARVEALLALARLRRDGGDVAAARELLERARAAAPAHAGVALELAELARSAGDLEREKALYEEILGSAGSRPDLWPVRVNLARALVELGDHDGARRAFEPLVERLPELEHQGLAPRDGHALATAYALLLAAAGELDPARRRLAAAAPSFTPAREAAAVLDAFGGDPAAAAVVLAATLPAHFGREREGVARANAGLALWLAGRGREAREHLAAAAASLPRHFGLRLALGEIALEGGDLAAARGHLEAAAARCDGGETLPDLPAGRELRVVLGSTQALCGRARERLGAVLAAAALDELAAGRGEAASELAERALALPLAGGEQAVAYLARGTARLLAGADRGARADLERALEGLSPALAAVARNNLGVARYRLGEFDAARAQFEAASATAEATLNLGILLDDHGGDAERALELYESYLARGGRRADVVAWIERLRKVYR